MSRHPRSCSEEEVVEEEVKVADGAEVTCEVLQRVMGSRGSRRSRRSRRSRG